jgi:hypothetical protein
VRIGGKGDTNGTGWAGTEEASGVVSGDTVRDWRTVGNDAGFWAGSSRQARRGAQLIAKMTTC